MAREFISLLKEETERHPNGLLTVLLIFMIIGFSFDHQFATVWQAISHGSEGVSNIWFLEDQYEFLKHKNNTPGVTPDLFRVFELSIWLTLALSIFRIFAAIFLLRESYDPRSRWKRRELPGFSYFIAWLLLSVGGMLMFSLGIKYTSSGHFAQDLLSYSPRSFIGLMAFAFCSSVAFFADGIVVLIQMTFEARQTQKAER
jgi:hypothetical protein